MLLTNNLEKSQRQSLKFFVSTFQNETTNSNAPLPKVKQASDPKKKLRPISLTSALSKIAEDFLVSDYIEPALEEVVDPN